MIVPNPDDWHRPIVIETEATKPWADAYKRREPFGDGDAGDLVKVNGVQAYGGAVDRGDNVVYLVISSLTFGGVSAEWSTSTALLSFDDFTAQYREADPAEVEVFHLQQREAALAADELVAKDKDRESPWANATPANRRTGRTKPDDAARVAHLAQERERLGREVERLEEKVTG